MKSRGPFAHLTLALSCNPPHCSYALIHPVDLGMKEEREIDKKG